jgi:hypothetical protein
MAQATETGGSRAPSRRKAAGKAKDLAITARSQTKRVAEQARDRVQDLVVRQKDEVAGRLDGVAKALHHTALTLEGNLDADLGRYAARAARQVDRLSNYLRDNDLRELARDTAKFARRRPELFLGGTFLAGLMLARFLKSSGGERPRSSYSPGRRSYGESHV